MNIYDQEHACRESHARTVDNGGCSDREMGLAWLLYSIERTGDAASRPADQPCPELVAPIYVDLARNILRSAANREALLRALADG